MLFTGCTENPFSSLTSVIKILKPLKGEPVGHSLGGVLSVSTKIEVGSAMSREMSAIASGISI